MDALQIAQSGSGGMRGHKALGREDSDNSVSEK